MSDNMKKFLELVSKDENLKQKMQSFNDMEPEKAIQAGIALAKELGIELSEADFAEEKSGGELNNDELDAVAGGARLAHFYPPCICIATGQGDDRTITDKSDQTTDDKPSNFPFLCVGIGHDDRPHCLILGV